MHESPKRILVIDDERELCEMIHEYFKSDGFEVFQALDGEQGFQAYASDKAKVAAAEYVVFNGKVGSLTDGNALVAKVGETVRLFIGNGGPNLISSFHVIGEIFDRVYPEGAVGSLPHANIQTTLIPAGGASIVEFRVEAPGTFLLVDHSIFRIDRGAVGMLKVEGVAQRGIFEKIP